VSLLFFVGTVGYKIIEFADRYFIDYYHTKEDVGIYTFYANLCNIIETFVHTAVIIIFSPRLIESFHRSSTQYSTTHFQFAKQVLIYTILAGIGLGLLIIPILHFLNNDEFVEYMNVFIMLALSKMVLNLSLIFHYILYVRKNDLSIIKATIFAALVNIALNFILIPSMGISGAALATLLSFIIILGMKIYYSRGLPEAKQIIYFRFMKSRN
jgi:O-antigen/teichoic acid export membrane protein